MELLPGARFRIPVQNPAGALGSGLVGRDPPGLRDQSSLTLRVGLVAVVHSSSGSHCPRDTLAFQPRALAFQPWA